MRLSKKIQNEKGSVLLWCMIFVFVALLVMQMVFSMAMLISRHQMDSALEASVLAALSRNETILADNGIDLGGDLNIDTPSGSGEIQLTADAKDVAKAIFLQNLPNERMVTCDMNSFKVETIEETDMWNTYITKKVRVSVNATYHHLFIINVNRDKQVNAMAEAVLSKRAVD